MVFLGQIPVTPTPGDPVASWLSVVIQGSAFALVVYIVTVLFPRMAQSVSEERQTRDKLFLAMIDTLQEKFDQRSTRIVTSIEKQTADITGGFQTCADRIEKAVWNVCKGGPK